MIQTHLLLVVFRMCFLICFVVFVFLVLTRASDLSVDMFLGSTNLMDGMEDLPPGIGQYDDFHTIDWLRDISRDRMRHRHIVKRRQEGCFEKLKAAHDAWSGWVCVLLVGCAAGLFCRHTQWHQLGYMQFSTWLQTDNHANTPPLRFLQAGCPSCHPTNSVKALKACWFYIYM